MKIENRLPRLPSECNIILLKPAGAKNLENSDTFRKFKVDFRVRRDYVSRWLSYLRQNHAGYRQTERFHTQELTCDSGLLDQLPEDDYVLDSISTVEETENEQKYQ